MSNHNERTNEERRRFLEKCGKFAVVTPPTVALMLSATGTARAQATSGSTTTTVTSSTVAPT